MARELHLLTPDNQTRKVALDGDSYSLGRAHVNDLCYPEDASLSRRHVKIEKAEDGWTVTDLGSKNGTLLNGTRITATQTLTVGDRINAGQLTMTFVDPDSSTPQRVVVFEETGSEAYPGATLMTSLEGLLSSEPSARRPSKTPVAERTFDSPVVQALIRAGRELSGHKPLEELFQLILDLSIDAVGAERGLLMTLEGDELVHRAVRGDGFHISTTVRDRVLQEKASMLVRDIQEEAALINQLSISGQQIRSLMAVPLQTDDQVIGLIYVDSQRIVRDFTPDDLNLLTVLANVAAIRIDHQRHLRLKEQEQRRDADLEQAAEIQRGILPEKAPEISGLLLAGHNVACRTVGGDYYDFIRYKDGRLAVVVGDVAGKGLSAALLVSSLQARIQLLTEEPTPLAPLMARLDRSIATCCPANRFITLFLCVIDPESGETNYCNAGHNPALLVRVDGTVEQLAPLGPVLGLLPGMGFHEATVQLNPGDLLAIYSDGVTESEDSAEDEFGEQRLAELLVSHRESSPAELIQAVNEAVDRWTNSAPAADDVTLVVVKKTDPS